ncbi:hypothetical protein BD413DRAFT_567489 [Trametes elegans]|nr:hypothetical protein BD413DRAFT_567489 [Trametes elegans]
MLARKHVVKVCPCAGGKCLTASLSTAGRTFPRKLYHSASQGQSIFSSSASPWDNIFDDIKDVPPPETPKASPTSRPLQLSSKTESRSKPVRQISVTARESQAIGEMFAQIFQSASQNKQKYPGVGLGRFRAGSIPSKYRPQSPRVHVTTATDEALDRKREEMELCETDAQLLEWAVREVFDEYLRYERSSQDALKSTDTDATASLSSSPSDDELVRPEGLHPSLYPHLLAALMRNFRDKYQDPHLALAMFDHARNLSTSSFVLGCTTPAYNELIQTRWECFRDLRGVVDALEEMRVNGIKLDSRTRALGENIRREVGERNLWHEETSIGSGEVWDLVARLERLAVADGPRFRRNAVDKNSDDRRPLRGMGSAKREPWKRQVLAESERQANFHYGKWSPQRARRTFMPAHDPGHKLKETLLANSR